MSGGAGFCAAFDPFIAFLSEKTSMCCSLPGIHRLRANQSKPRHLPPINHDRLGEHRRRADPEAVVAILLPVDDELLERLAVPGDAKHRVLVSLVVAIATRADFRHALLPMLEPSNTVTGPRS